VDIADLQNRFRFHPADTKGKQDAHEHVREQCRRLAENLNELLPEGREKSLAVTNLEQAMFWSNAALARAGDG
jgi:hypothetical protein